MLARELGSRRDVGQAARDLFLEFAPAEALDAVLRPACLFAALALVPSPALGLLIGKLAADVAFYLPVVATHEVLRRRGSRRAPRSLSPSPVAS